MREENSKRLKLDNVVREKLAWALGESIIHSNSRRRSMSGYRCAQIQASLGHSRSNAAILNPAGLVIDAASENVGLWAKARGSQLFIGIYSLPTKLPLPMGPGDCDF